MFVAAGLGKTHQCVIGPSLVDLSVKFLDLKRNTTQTVEFESRESYGGCLLVC